MWVHFFQGLSELQELHRSCLETGVPPAPGSKNPWLSESPEQDADRALQVLRDLGERKAQKLAQLKPGPGLGPRILQLCDWMASACIPGFFLGWTTRIVLQEYLE